MLVEIKGTEIKLTFSFVFVLSLMLIFCDENIVLMCMAASLLHEGGHLFFVKLFGERILSICFGAFGVRIERSGSVSLPYKQEAFVALGGIIVNFLLAFLSIMYYYLMKSYTALMFFLINILIALFNCIPLYVLDMGRALRYFLLISFNEEKSEKILSVISLVFVNVLAVVCCLYSAFFSVNVSLIAVTVYLYVITLFKKWS